VENGNFPVVNWICERIEHMVGDLLDYQQLYDIATNNGDDDIAQLIAFL
jgi:hypothetical protein